ncbi:hypothetical protein KBD71_04870 [Candidatus Woesebacteria bacterium]|nr:hypothetical protein [Candidatus Woesebacteria bacterium]
MAVNVEISYSSDRNGNWYFRKSSSAAVQVLALLTTGKEVVSGESGPYKNKAEAQKAAKYEAGVMEGKGVTVRYRE